MAATQRSPLHTLCHGADSDCLRVDRHKQVRDQSLNGAAIEPIVTPEPSLGSTTHNDSRRSFKHCLLYQRRPGSAQVSVVKSRTPNPPSSIGRVILGHSTMQRPPEAVDVPCQMKAR
jgi:hypothetical protein